jgi:hypothetical protein
MSQLKLSEMQAVTPVLEIVVAKYDALRARLNAATAAADQSAVLSDWNELRSEIDTWASLVQIRYQQDTENADFKAAREVADEMAPKLTEQEVSLKRLLLESPFRAELEAFAGSCLSGKPNELTAHNGNVAVALTNAALKSIDRKGLCVTVDEVIHGVDAKPRLAEDTGADIVDMETWAVAREAGRAGLPCLGLRVVSDAAADSLPGEITRLAEARSPWHRIGLVIRTVGRRPSAIGDLWGLWERAVVDSRTLADALELEVAALPALSPPATA